MVAIFSSFFDLLLGLICVCGETVYIYYVCICKERLGLNCGGKEDECVDMVFIVFARKFTYERGGREVQNYPIVYSIIIG